ncbi:MAG: ferredoxin [Candidatus Woesearchaeota archaeon]
MPKIVINREECIGCALCESYDSKHFKRNDDDGKMDLVGGTKEGETTVLEVSKEDLEKIKEAMEDCPIKAIRIEE